MYCHRLSTISARSNVFGFLDTTACPATDARQPSVMAPRLLSWIVTVTASLSWASYRPALNYFSLSVSFYFSPPPLFSFFFFFFSEVCFSVFCKGKEIRLCPRVNVCIEHFQEFSCVRILLMMKMSLIWTALFPQIEPCSELLHWC